MVVVVVVVHKPFTGDGGGGVGGGGGGVGVDDDTDDDDADNHTDYENNDDVSTSPASPLTPTRFFFRSALQQGAITAMP